MKQNVITALIFGLFYLFPAVGDTHATMVIKRSFNQIAQESVLIFEGKVLSKETRVQERISILPTKLKRTISSAAFQTGPTKASRIMHYPKIKSHP